MQQALSLLQNHLDKYQPTDLYIAYSGGVDSSALLHLSTKFKDKINLHAVHIHHGLSQNADHWFHHCQAEAARLGANFIFERLTPPLKKTNLENWARNKRYAFFEKIMLSTPNSLLLSAHHTEDQAETFLLQALRGSGIKGLAGIAEHKPFAKGYLLRPFLHLTKEKLIAYCRENRLSWVEDESNQSLHFRRNRIRHNIIPAVQQITPSAATTLARCAQLCAESSELLNELLHPVLPKITIDNTKLDLIKLNTYSDLQHRYLLKIWLDQHKAYSSHEQLMQIYQGTKTAFSNWQFSLGNRTLEIQNKVLLIHSSNKELTILSENQLIDDDSNWSCELLLHYPPRRPDHFKVVRQARHSFTSEGEFSESASLNSPSLAKGVKPVTVLQWLNERMKLALHADDIIIRERQPGDRCHPVDRDRSQKLKIIFQEKGISAIKRQQALIVCLKENPHRIIAIYPFFVCH
ncbi:tRNA lysidine(34) synthetase TilS [Caedibacter taeniospiralis]|jgi:tRNA(Ile)-lysidine synthase|uniref:tRNA lysidine(34) synthetase TilS n=1 Tax=Caedibacter taeniospiralis TaxID=28907 RepID=UPI0037C1879A